MMRKLLLVLLTFLVFRANAQENGVVRAVIVGVSQYKNLDSSYQLNYADRDARAFYNFVLQGGFGPVKKENIHLLENDQANFAQIRRTSLLTLFPKDLQPNDHTIIYFAGHGDVQSEFNSAFLLAHDAPVSSDYHLDGAWEIEELEKNIQRASKRGLRVSLFVDACRSGKALSKMGSRKALEELSSNWENIVKVVSCGPEQLSQEDSRWGGGHGVFTYYLLRAFSGLADTDDDRKIRVFELNEYLSKEVRKETQMKQIPRCSGPDTRVVVEINPEISLALESEAKPAGNKRSRGILSSSGSNRHDFPGKKKRIKVPADNLLLTDSLFNTFYHSLKTGYLTKNDLPESDAYLLDTLPSIRLKPFEIPGSISLINEKKLSIIYKEGYEVYDPREGSLIHREAFSPDAGKLLKIQKNLVLHQLRPKLFDRYPGGGPNSKQNRKLLITNTHGKLSTRIRPTRLLTISNISISPSGEKAMVFGHPPKKKSERLMLILDLEKAKQTGTIILPEKTEFDNLVFSPDEKSIYGIRVLPGLPVLQFPLENGKSESIGKEIFRYSKDAKTGLHLSSGIISDGTALEIVRSTGRDTIRINESPAKPLLKKQTALELYLNNDSLFLGRGIQADSSERFIRKLATGESAIHVNPQLILFHKKDKIQGMDLIVRPGISAEDALAAIPADHPKKYRAALLLATILEEKGSEVVNQYLKTGTIEPTIHPVDDVHKMSQSIKTGTVVADRTEMSLGRSALEKAITLYPDSTFAQGALRKLKLLNGLILSQKKDRGSQNIARRYFEELGRENPKAAYPVNALGEWMNANSMPEEASEVLRNSMRLAPKWEVPKQNLWKSYLMLGKTEEARQGLERLIQGNFPAEAGIKLLEIYTQTGDFSRATRVLKRLISRYPNVPDVLVAEARFYAAKGVYWRAWKNILRVLKNNPGYPSAIKTLMELPGSGRDKAYYLQKPDISILSMDSLKTIDAQPELTLERYLLIQQYPRLVRQFPVTLHNKIHEPIWKPGIQSFLLLMAEKKSLESYTIPKEAIFQDLYDFSTRLNAYGFQKEAAHLLKLLAQAYPAELRCRYALAKILLELKKPLESGPVIQEMKSLLEIRTKADSSRNEAILELEKQIKNNEKDGTSGIATAARWENVYELLDSLVHLRDLAGLKSPSAYIESISGLKPRALNRYFQSRLKGDDLGIYRSAPDEHFGLNHLTALQMDASGFGNACRIKMEKLAASFPDNPLPVKWLSNKGSFLPREKKQLKESYLSLAFNVSGKGPWYSITEGDNSILVNPDASFFNINVPFAVERIISIPEKDAAENDVDFLLVRNSDQTYSFLRLQGFENDFFKGNFIQVAELVKLPGSNKMAASVLTKNGWGVMMADSSWLVPDAYQAVDIQREGLTGKYHFEVRKNQKTGIYNQEGKITVPVIYDQLAQDFGTYGQFSLQTSLNCLEYQSGKPMPSKCQLVSKSKSLASGKAGFAPTDYSNNYQFGLRVARYYDELGYANPKNEFVIPAMYKEAGDFVQVNDKILAFVSLGGKEGFIGLDGKPLVPLSYTECGKFFEEHLVQGCQVPVVSARKNNMMGIFDADHRIIIPFEFEEIPFLTRYRKMSYFGGKKGNLFGLFDLSGKVILPPQFDAISIKGPGVFLLESEGLFFEYSLANDEFKEVTMAKD